MEVLCTVMSKVTELLFDSIGRQIGYIWNYNNNIQTLKHQVEILKCEEESVLHRTSEAERNGEEIESVVETWLRNVNQITNEAGNILENNDTASKNCFMGLCPNLKIRHQLSRKAKKQTPFVVEVRGEGKFERVSHRIPPEGVMYVEVHEGFESRKLVIEGIVKALQNVDVSLVGVYGMGGVGKTTLVKQVSSLVKEHGIFDLVVTATVTHTPELKRIQQEIAEWLDYKFEVESVDVRAARLNKRLKRVDKILVILDDIWATIKLGDIGIPWGNDHKGCKILMTSRNQNVLLEMSVQRYFRLDVLTDEEAWVLFEKKVGDFKDSNLLSIAIEVARRCAGLPVLIVTVAAALRNKELYEWKDALEQLKRFDDDEIDEQVKSALELSYNLLKGDEIKSLFLVCAQLYPYNIHIIDLFKYAVGLDLFKRSGTLEEARCRLLKLVNDLKASCLLLEGDRHGQIKMHDVVYNFAISIAWRDRNIFILPYHTELKKWPKKENLEQCTAISLPFCKIPEYPVDFACPKLKSLLLLGAYPSPITKANFFSAMEQLEVLDLTQMHLSPLPFSLKFLQNLQTLCLDYCVLEDIAIVGELRKLQVLSLVGSDIVRLPIEVRQLNCLRLLDLSNCSSLTVIPPNILSSLEQLEDLYIANSFVQWEKEEHNEERNNANLAELKALSRLVTLDLHIIDAKILPKDLFSGKLERFRIFIGDEWDWSGEYENSRTLKLKLNTGIQLVEKAKGLLKRTEDLYLDELTGVTDILYQLDQEGFPHLRHLHVSNSLEIQYIIDSTSIVSHVAFPRLESLFIDYLINLEKICQGQLKLESFNSLRKLNVRNCNRLKNLFSFSMARGLAQLEEITVSSCKLMEEIVSNETGDDEAFELPQLHALTLEYLPQLMSFSYQLKAPFVAQTTKLLARSAASEEIVSGDECLPLFNEKIRFPNLTDLKLSSIRVEKIWSNQLMELYSCINNLSTLVVDGCRTLNYLFASSTVEHLSQLKKLEISDCNSMKEVIATQGFGEGDMLTKFPFPKLEFIKLKSLPVLISFCTGNLIECPSLKVLQIESCPQLKTFISNYISTGVASNYESGPTNSTLFDEKVAFPKLEELHIMHLPKLRKIWHDEIQEHSFCKLKVLKVDHVEELLKVFPSKMPRAFRNLESLTVNNCHLLEGVFDLQVEATQLRTLGLRNLSNLKHVWNADSKGSVSFDKLRSMYVWDCPNLKSLFPTSVARNLRGLEMLDIDNCGLEEIVSKEEKIETIPNFVLPRLKSLDLWRLQELESFYSGTHTLKCPVLEKLIVYHCERLKIFDSEPQETHAAVAIQVQKPLFCFREVVSNLEELALNAKDAEMIREDHFPAGLFHKLKILHLQCNYASSAGFPFHHLHKFQNLQKLVIKHSYFRELFPYDIAGEDATALERIRFLKLDFLPDMRHIWNQDSQSSQLLQNLQTLEIWSCHGLINLAPSSASFENLTTLDVWKCQGLINLLTPSAAKGMVNLTKMTVRESHMVTEIVANERNECQFQSEISFCKLTILRLLDLSSLTSFSSSASCTIKLPSLEVLVVTQCPNVIIFSQGILNTPKLKKVCLTEEGDKWCWVKDLNTTIQQSVFKNEYTAF